MSERTTTTAETPSTSYGRLETEMLRAWYDEDPDEVDTAVIPRLALGTVLVPVAVPATSPATSTPAAAATVAPAPVAPSPAVSPAPVTPSPVPASARSTTRHRHASPESLAAVRRNHIALTVVVVATVLLGVGVGITAGWVGILAYALLVGTLLLAQHRVNRRYAPRHSRYMPRHV